LMLWIQLNVLSILIGFELNASIVINKRIQGVEEKIMEAAKQQIEVEDDHYSGA